MRHELYCLYMGMAIFALSLLLLACFSPSPQYTISTPSQTSDVNTSSQTNPALSIQERSGNETLYGYLFPTIEEPKRRLPNALIVGCAKCGTRALLFYLQFHPDITIAGPEIHFFNREDRYNKGYGWYIQFFPPRLQNQIGIEKTPAYFTVEGVPEKIFKMNNSIKIIIIVCEPVRKAISQFAQLMDKSHKTAETLELLMLNPLTGELDYSKNILTAGIYQMHLQRWLRWFPLKQMLFVDGDRLRIDPMSELRRAEAFLAVSHYLQDDLIVFNKTKGFFCVYERRLRCLSDDKGRSHPPVDPMFKQKLADFYRPFNHQFMRSVGRRFNWDLWN